MAFTNNLVRATGSNNNHLTAKNATHRNDNRSDIRIWSQEKRKKLDLGEVVDVVNVEGKTVTKMRLTTFNAVSTKPGLYFDRAIRLPDTIHDEIHEQAVKWLIQNINKLSAELIPGLKDAFRDFHLCFVAEVMGMRKYTQHIFNEYYLSLKSHLLDYDHMIGISRVDNALGRRFFRDVSYNLAILAWNREILDFGAFDDELATNARLARSIGDFIDIWCEAEDRAEAAGIDEAREKRSKEWEDMEMAREVEKRASEKAHERATREIKQKKEVELRERVIRKKRAGENLDREEALMHYAMYGKHVPV
ncbi:Nn.00g027500.m01.CDS01 [Neocucurbitaria sp. VM-36]